MLAAFMLQAGPLSALSQQTAQRRSTPSEDDSLLTKRRPSTVVNGPMPVQIGQPSATEGQSRLFFGLLPNPFSPRTTEAPPQDGGKARPKSGSASKGTSGPEIRYTQQLPDSVGKGSPRLGTPFPNPASAEVKIEYSAGTGSIVVLHIYDFLGKPVKSLSLRKNGTSILLDVNNMQPGIYFYSLEVDGKVIGTKRLVISR